MKTGHKLLASILGALACPAGSVGGLVNQKTLENLQRRQKAFPDKVGTTLNRISMFSESGQRHSAGLSFFRTFLDRQKSTIKTTNDFIIKKHHVRF